MSTSASSSSRFLPPYAEPERDHRAALGVASPRRRRRRGRRSPRRTTRRPRAGSRAASGRRSPAASVERPAPVARGVRTTWRRRADRWSRAPSTARGLADAGARAPKPRRHAPATERRTCVSAPRGAVPVTSASSCTTARALGGGGARGLAPPAAPGVAAPRSAPISPTIRCSGRTPTVTRSGSSAPSGARTERPLPSNVSPARARIDQVHQRARRGSRPRTGSRGCS